MNKSSNKLSKNKYKHKNTSNALFSDFSEETVREKRAPKLPKIDPSLRPALIFSFSMITSISLILMGISLFFLNLTSLSILIGLSIILIGTIQIVVDIGWIGLVKVNHEDTIKTWKEAYFSLANIRGKNIFILPIIIDLFFLAIAIVSLFVR